MGDLSTHFSRAEFRCHGHGKRGHVAHTTDVDLELVGRLELLREIVGGKPLKIISGHRCRWWNRQVGGATRSQHLITRAADIPYGYATVEQAARAGFKGIGRKGRYAVHVDTRATTARWVY